MRPGEQAGLLSDACTEAVFPAGKEHVEERKSHVGTAARQSHFDAVRAHTFTPGNVFDRDVIAVKRKQPMPAALRDPFQGFAHQCLDLAAFHVVAGTGPLDQVIKDVGDGMLFAIRTDDRGVETADSGSERDCICVHASNSSIQITSELLVAHRVRPRVRVGDGRTQVFFEPDDDLFHHIGDVAEDDGPASSPRSQPQQALPDAGPVLVEICLSRAVPKRVEELDLRAPISHSERFRAEVVPQPDPRSISSEMRACHRLQDSNTISAVVTEAGPWEVAPMKRTAVRARVLRPTDRDERGFTLIELLVVTVVVSLLAGLVGPLVWSKLRDARIRAARAQIELFGAALDQYRLDVGSYPTTGQGLAALRDNPGVERWSGPYLKKPAPKDPWGGQYRYRCCPGQHGPYDLWSEGADHAPGGEGENRDVGSWEDES